MIPFTRQDISASPRIDLLAGNHAFWSLLKTCCPPYLGDCRDGPARCPQIHHGLIHLFIGTPRANGHFCPAMHHKRSIEPELCGYVGKKKMAVSPFRDVWIHILTWVMLTSTAACGIWQMVVGGKVISPLLISVAWAIYGNVAPSLVLWYTLLPLALPLSTFWLKVSILKPRITGAGRILSSYLTSFGVCWCSHLS